jgi:hypothetical protein
MLMGKLRGPSTTRDMKTTTASNTDLASAGRTVKLVQHIMNLDQNSARIKEQRV